MNLRPLKVVQHVAIHEALPNQGNEPA